MVAATVKGDNKAHDLVPTQESLPPIQTFRSKRHALVCLVAHTVRRAALTALFTLFIRNLYMRVAKMWRWGDRSFWVMGTVLVHAIAYITVNGPLLACDHFKLLQKYKMHRPPAQTPSSQLMLRTLTEAAVGQLVVGPFQLWWPGYAIFKYFGMPERLSSIPSFLQLVWQYSICGIINYGGFYAVHRLCHESKWLYKNVHKKHHEYKGTIGIAAEHAHPLEAFFANLLPTIGGSLFFGRHPLVFWTFLADRLLQTYEGHSGYCFAGTWLHRIGLTNANAQAFHDHHHTANDGNYASATLDFLFDTMTAWDEAGGMDAYLAKNRKGELKMA